ncbi:MAG: hypothetical protein LBJ15_24735 [Comamonas sp.]|jgi:hypothetical protein|uniref:hypothetical protein n=1 Tax=Comamonas sp. TaxID=34028 RepID=UPI0028209D70|nr:hypothetical protein [Comamonas sp.]MDR0217191.1 hypothetical protein [Comamonas sp.]
MHTSPLFHPFEARVSERVAAVLRVAKLLHRQAVADSRMQSLPVLRRLISNRVLLGLNLPQLFVQKAMVQRKHVLQMLALEAGMSDWASYRDALAGENPDVHLPLEAMALRAGYPNHWFSTLEQAREHAAQRGGQVVQVGTQAVVLPNVAEAPAGHWG